MNLTAKLIKGIKINFQTVEFTLVSGVVSVAPEFVFLTHYCSCAALHVRQSPMGDCCDMVC